MRRFIVPAVIVTLCVMLIATMARAATVKMVVEGEDYSSIKPSIAVTASQGADGGKAIYIPLRRPHATTETGPGDDGNARFKVKVPTAGVYQLWARTWWYDSCGNSFFIVVDSNPATYIEDATYQTWHWVKGPKLTLSAGEHTIRFQNREDGARLDQFMLINSTRYVPTRAETRTPQYIVK